MTPIYTWGSYFCEIVHLLEAADRQYGIANQSYAQYVLERLEICLQTCRTVRGQITPTGGTGRLQWYLEAFDELISCLQLIRRKWEEYQNILDSGSPNEALAYTAFLWCTLVDEGGLDLMSPRNILLPYPLHGVT